MLEHLMATSRRFNRFLLSHLNARLSLSVGSLVVGRVEYDRLMGREARVARCLAGQFDPDPYPSTSPTVQLSQDEISLRAALSANAPTRPCTN